MKKKMPPQLLKKFKKAAAKKTPAKGKKPTKMTRMQALAKARKTQKK